MTEDDKKAFATMGIEVQRGEGVVIYSQDGPIIVEYVRGGLENGNRVKLRVTARKSVKIEREMCNARHVNTDLHNR